MNVGGDSRYRGLCECGDHAWAILTKGFVTLVSPEDAALVSQRNWSANFRYGIAYAEGGGRRLHRQIIATGPHTDHQNRNGVDNRRPNLRGCSASENAANAGVWRIAGRTSRFKGVHLDKKRGLWRADIRAQYRKRHLGYFYDETEAAAAYDAAAVAAFGEFARTNQMMGLLP